MPPEDSDTTVVGVIPARWASTRFPGKMLAEIRGRPLLQWVVERAQRAEALDGLLVATDDGRIFDLAARIGVEAVMTRADHSSGTDRIAEAISKTQAGIVVNIQGDEPLIDPLLIDTVAQALMEERDWDMSTAAAPIDDIEDIDNASVVKVVCDEDQKALYFSRAPIPFSRDGEERTTGTLYWRHIGLYGYRRSFWERLVKEPVCMLERTEKLEQLRALYMGGRIKVIETEDVSLGVDTPEDVERVERRLSMTRDR